MNVNRFVTCGTLKESVGFSDIVCDITTGDLIFCDDVNGNCIMSNMSVTDPMYIDGSPAPMNIVNEMGLDGVIMSDSYLITLKDGVAEYRDYSDAMKVMHRVEYDLDIEYDGELD